MGYYRCLHCNNMTGIASTKCSKCGWDDIEHCTCGSGGHPRKCDLHPDEYYLHCFDLDISSLLEDNFYFKEEMEESPYWIHGSRDCGCPMGTNPKECPKRKMDIIAIVDEIVERAKLHLITRRDKND